MSEQEILDGNKLIAEFMGAKYNSKLDLVNLGANHKLVGINELQYHSSWDWIMPVVDKIRKTGKIVLIEFHDEEVVCQIRHTWESLVADFGGSSNNQIDATYTAVVEFIKWHNKQQGK